LRIQSAMSQKTKPEKPRAAAPIVRNVRPICQRNVRSNCNLVQISRQREVANSLEIGYFMLLPGTPLHGKLAP
jgi:hypothetical protein